MSESYDYTYIRLINGGWERLRSGKWIHPGLPTTAGRRRPFTTEQALTLLDAETNEVVA